MGIRTDSDLQQTSIEDGHNPYSAEDMAIYTPEEIDLLCEQQEDIAQLFEETRKLVESISGAIDRLAPVIKDVLDNIEKIAQEADIELEY